MVGSLAIVVSVNGSTCYGALRVEYDFVVIKNMTMMSNQGRADDDISDNDRQWDKDQ